MSSDSSGEEDSDSDSGSNEDSVMDVEQLSFPTHIMDKIFDKRSVVDDFKEALKLRYNSKNQTKFDI
jgi:hypothetical protein